jgi:hypothetical protein
MKQTKRTPLIGLDTVEFTVHGEGMHLPQNGVVKLLNEDGTVKWSGENAIAIKGRFDAHNMTVRTTAGGTRLKVSVSPYGWKYGQNAFTPTDLGRAIRGILKDVQRITGLRPSPSKDGWAEAEIHLDRVDLNVLHRLPSEDLCSEVVRQIKHVAVDANTNAHLRRNYVLLSPRGGRAVSKRAYPKGAEIMESGKCSDENFKQRLANQLVGHLRSEIQFRREALVEEGLDRVCDWTEDKARALFAKHYAADSLFDLPRLTSISADELADLPLALRRAVLIKSTGVDPVIAYGPDTWKKLLTQMRKAGWNPTDSWVPTSVAIDLQDLLKLENAVDEVAQWLIDEGFYPKQSR